MTPQEYASRERPRTYGSLMPATGWDDIPFVAKGDGTQHTINCQALDEAIIRNK
ncbi:hypothetical protein DSO57_1025465 [Entomophthora muscae]|uniref:Uncharacterized protein n=1 Tax=Entomophthora muscae TaxID=34485 RepID=A0ACC2UMY6_9FUNG|nr:hypothetical protein DSO57_1025465 [Entomophthora muscae]